MILPDMTSEQMMRVLETDRPHIQLFADRYMNGEGKRILRSQHTAIPCTLTKFFVAPESHQRYLINYRIANRHEAYSGITRYYVRAIINTEHGTEAANMLYDRKDNRMQIVYFQAHLFKRYAERMGLKVHGDDIIRIFTKRNHVLIEASQWRTEQDCMMLCYDGACFGEIRKDDPYMFRLKTFIATDTMQDDTYSSKLNETFDGAMCEFYWEQYFHDPEMAEFMMKTTHPRKIKTNN